jgi:predicted ester cyclase
LHGTHFGPLAGIAATGKRVTMQELVFWQVVEGKLRAIWSQGDSLE